MRSDVISFRAYTIPLTCSPTITFDQLKLIENPEFPWLEEPLFLTIMHISGSVVNDMAWLIFVRVQSIFMIVAFICMR